MLQNYSMRFLYWSKSFFSILGHCNILKTTNLWTHLVPLQAKLDICTCKIFCRKFKSQQLLFEAFFNIIGIFSSTDSLSESTFPFQYIVIFETWQSLEPDSSIPRGDKRVRRLSFCRKFNSQQLLFDAFFDIIRIFGSIQSSISGNDNIYFPFTSVQRWQTSLHWGFKWEFQRLAALS